jgi:hypothetical protein
MAERERERETEKERGNFIRNCTMTPMSKKTLVGAAIRSREVHSDEKITHHEVGWSPLRNHPIYNPRWTGF